MDESSGMGLRVWKSAAPILALWRVWDILGLHSTVLDVSKGRIKLKIADIDQEDT
jgi:hypothetical protein